MARTDVKPGSQSGLTNKGYGFISRPSGEDVFVLILQSSRRVPQSGEGDQVEFAIQQDQKGQACGRAQDMRTGLRP